MASPNDLLRQYYYKYDTLKGKTHRLSKNFKVNGFMKTINHTIQVEIGVGNNMDDVSPDTETTYIKLSNRGDLNIGVRLSKDGKERMIVPLSPADNSNGITLFFTGKDAAAYMRAAHEYIGYMMDNVFDFPRLKNPDCTNDEERFSDRELL